MRRDHEPNTQRDELIEAIRQYPPSEKLIAAFQERYGIPKNQAEERAKELMGKIADRLSDGELPAFVSQDGRLKVLNVLANPPEKLTFEPSE